jgi:hypothetical protein
MLCGIRLLLPHSLIKCVLQQCLSHVLLCYSSKAHNRPPTGPSLGMGLPAHAELVKLADQSLAVQQSSTHAIARRLVKGCSAERDDKSSAPGRPQTCTCNTKTPQPSMHARKTAMCSACKCCLATHTCYTGMQHAHSLQPHGRQAAAVVLSVHAHICTCCCQQAQPEKSPRPHRLPSQPHSSAQTLTRWMFMMFTCKHACILKT